MNKKKLLKLAAFLRTIPTKKFDMDHWSKTPEINATTCGTAACACGWGTTIFKRYKNPLKLVLEEDYPGYNPVPIIACGEERGFDAAATFFEISNNEANYLFWSGDYPSVKITPKMVAKRIKQFVKKGGR